MTAPFLVDADDRWISDFVDHRLHRFETVHQPAQELSWHEKRVARTGVIEWIRFARTARRALSAASANGGGVVTVFPQMAAAVGLQKQALHRDAPVVAWFFNTNVATGSRGSTARDSLARRALDGVDHFVVHSTVEIEAYASELEIPHHRFSFAPIQYGGTVQSDPEETDSPFVFATGSGFRDYGTLFEALARLDLPAKIVAGDRILAGLDVPSNVEILSGVDRSEIHRLIRQARVNVVPLTLEGLTAGIVTVVETYRHGRGLVITRRSGLEDYSLVGRNALEAEPFDSTSMAGAIEAMWHDESLRADLGAGALEFAQRHCTDEAAAGNLAVVLDRVISSR